MSGAPETAFDPESFLTREYARIEAARGRLLDELLAGAPARVADPIRYALDAGGKRLRPILCVAAYRAVGSAASSGRAADGAPARSARAISPEAADAIYDVACAVELVHTYSLVHDDLPCMDDDALRRGRPTTHRVFGVAAATVAGAALIPLACRALDRGGAALGLDAGERMALVRELCVAAGGGGMVGGQFMDLEAEGGGIPLAELEAIHHCKTGALLASALRIGALAARGRDATLDALGAYGRRLGLAFQIADDVLDVAGTTRTLGKTAGRDEALAKATVPSLLGVDGARQRAETEAAAAVAALRGAGIDSPPLEALARYTVERDR